jgi:hypothetical protein
MTCDMNKLELQLAAHSVANDGKLYLVVDINVDGVAIVNFDSYATNLNEFERSITESGNFYIVTCWCGDALCAGIEKPVHVHHEHEFVRWQMPSPKPLRHFVFERANYLSALPNLIAQGEQLIDDLLRSVEKPLDITPNRNASTLRLRRKA